MSTDMTQTCAYQPDVVQFSEAWQATAWGIVEGLKARGLLSASDWAQALGAEIAKRDQQTEAEYYEAYLAALETVLLRATLLTAPRVDDRVEAWREAYLATPHGKPVHLKR